jgi:hypothetical protein
MPVHGTNPESAFCTSLGYKPGDPFLLGPVRAVNFVRYSGLREHGR